MQIGARNMQNYRLLEAVGGEGKPVLLERGPAASLDKCLRQRSTSSTRAIPASCSVKHGIRTFETHTRFSLTLASVPYLHDRTHLPVIVDPSHGTGHTAVLVSRMAAAAVAAGADGLIVEVHPDPEAALSDGYESMTFTQLERDDAVVSQGGGGG